MRETYDRKSYCKEISRHERNSISDLCLFCFSVVVYPDPSMLITLYYRTCFIYSPLRHREIKPFFDLFSFFHVPGGNYQGGKQQRGGGGRQPRHQPY